MIHICEDCNKRVEKPDPLYMFEDGEYVCENCWNVWSHPGVFVPAWLRSYQRYVS